MPPTLLAVAFQGFNRRRWWWVCLLLAAAMAAPNLAAAQISSGNDFIFGFLQHPGFGPFELYLTPSSGDLTVQVEYPVGTTLGPPISLVQGSVSVATLPSGMCQAWSFGTPIPNAVRVFSTDPSKKFTCTMASRSTAVSATALILPVASLGYSYRVVAVTSANIGAQGGQFVVVATEDNTHVTMTPTVPLVSGEPSGVPINVTLNRGEGWLAGMAHDGDLTGTPVVSDKPVAVTNGATSNYIESGGTADGIVEVAQPVTAWGSSVLVANLPGFDTQGVPYRLMAAENATTIRQDGATIATLDAGQFIETRLAGDHLFEGVAGGTPKPIFVVQLMPGLATTLCNDGDPGMCNMIPISQYETGHSFYTIGDGQFCHYATIIARNQDAGSLKLDGAAIPAGNFTGIGSSGFSVARIQLALGSHTTESSLGHAVTVEGYGFDDSYLSPAGSMIPVISPLQPPTLLQPDDMTVREQTTKDQGLFATDADGDPLTFTLSVGPPFATVTTISAGTGTATGNIHVAPGASDVGGYSATVMASDGSLSDSRTLTITVTPNQTPTLAAPSDMTVPEGATTDQALNATDANGDPLTFTLPVGPPFATVTTTSPGTGTATGNIHLAPAISDVGMYSATIEVSDGALSDNKTLTITVTPNQTPELAQPSDMTVPEEATQDQVLNATDANADPLTFTLSSGPPFATVTTTSPGTGTATGNLHLAPGASDVGSYPATIEVSDGALTDSRTITITVLPNMPDVTRSYFVPEAGSVTTPQQGAAAIASARRCPNDDGTQVLRLAARLKVVVIGTNTQPMAGISAADICVLFNGGTGLPSPPNQGFSGVGDDSIIATSQYNPASNCPDIRCVSADGPTDALGVAYITWIGHNPADPPGVVTSIGISRDPFRKWGGYAGDIPVMVMGVKLMGKLAETGPGNVLGSYTAHVKDLDSVGGRTTALNQGELVNQLDINPVQLGIGHPYKYQLDFDNNGVVNAADLNIVKAHNNHKCNFPIAN